MKIFCNIFIILLLFFSNSFTQIDTTSLAFYPLNDGDYWEYLQEIDDWWYPPGSYDIYYSYEVIGDTIFPIGKTYKIIETTKLDSTQRNSYLFERIDSTTCNVYRYDISDSMEYLIDSLNSQIGDSCKATRTFPFDSHKTICTFIRSDNILNRTTISKVFVEQHWHAPIDYKLSKGFGLTYLNYYFDFGTFTQHLLYARIDGIEYGTQVNSIPKDNYPVLDNYQLYQNHPNPFNPITNIQFSISKSEYVTLKIFNLLGQEVITLVSDILNSGIHSYTWNASGFASGVYIISLQSKKQSQIKKCLLIK